MTVGARRVFAGAAVVCAACLVTAAGLRAQDRPRAGPDGGRDLQDRPAAARHPRGHVLRGDGDVRQLDGQRLHLLPRVERGARQVGVCHADPAHPARAAR